MNLARYLGFSLASRGLLSTYLSQKATPLRLFHMLGVSMQPKPLLLEAKVPQLTSTCGFKVKGKLKRRCKDCYFVVRDERTYIICATHPRHKQMSFIKKEKNNRIMTPFAMQSKQRPW